MSHLVDQYPLYSKADLALWDMGQAYGRLGNRFRKQEGEAYAKIVRDYPLSPYADDATGKLKELELPVPEADKAAVARMEYEKDHRVKPGIVARDTLALMRGPDMSTAARSGDPAMTTMRPSVPPLVPQARRRRRRIQRRCDRDHGGRFNGARYQARCSRESARAGWRGRRQPSQRRSGRDCESDSRSYGFRAAGVATSVATNRRRSESEEEEKQEAATAGRPNYRSARYCCAGCGPARVSAHRSIELRRSFKSDEPNPAG